jgi:hypothetical protein
MRQRHQKPESVSMPWRISALVLMTVAFAGIALAEPAKTSKERLSDKASDDQRVDNCRVPPARRGATVRPDCSGKAAPAAAKAKSGATPTR